MLSRVKYIEDRNEAELLAEVAAGNQAAFRQLFEQHASFVYNTVVKILGNRQDAEDVAQDVFFTLWKKAGSIRGESKLSTWLYRVAVNKAINARKRGGVAGELRQLLSIDDVSTLDLSAPEETRPDRHQEQQAARDELGELMAGLPERQREVYLLHKLEGLSYKEIAAQLDITLSSVESIMHRAKVKLQKQMLKKYKKTRK